MQKELAAEIERTRVLLEDRKRHPLLAKDRLRKVELMDKKNQTLYRHVVHF